MNILLPENTENYGGNFEKFDGWFSEGIWGHRLKRQSSAMLMMEFLGMAEAMFRADLLLKHTRPADNASYRAHQSKELRTLLYNNPRMEQIRNDCQDNNEHAWDTWLKTIKNDASIEDKFEADFTYLRERFVDFKALVERISLLRRITMDPGSNRKWTQQFLFPIGPAALYEVSDEKFIRERTVFTRTGEVAYLMLTRASEPLCFELRENLEKLFDPETSRNKLILSLFPNPLPTPGDEKGGTYLPYVTHPAYDRMAEDINNLLKLGLPNQDALEHIKYLLAFNLYIYATETPRYWLGYDTPADLVCEIPGPRMDVVRKASIAYRDENESLGFQALGKYLDMLLTSSPEVNAKLGSADLSDEAKASALAALVADKCKLKLADLPSSHPDKVKEMVAAMARDGYRSGTMDAIQGLGLAAGLTDRRGTTRHRYAPTDKLLRALVLANVKWQIEEKQFLQKLYDRYRIIIAPREAASLPNDFYDEGDFKKNCDRFTKRLIGLGLARRMSDACNYITNPYFRQTH